LIDTFFSVHRSSLRLLQNIFEFSPLSFSHLFVEVFVKPPAKLIKVQRQRRQRHPPKQAKLLHSKFSSFFFSFGLSCVSSSSSSQKWHLLESSAEAGFLVRVHPEPCLILSSAQIRALLCSSKSKFIPA
jgi:hypothetical protein